MKRKFLSFKNLTTSLDEEDSSAEKSANLIDSTSIAETPISSNPQQEIVSDFIPNSSAGNPLNFLENLLELLQKLREGISSKPPPSLDNPHPDFLHIPDSELLELPSHFKHWRRRYFRRRDSFTPSAVQYSVAFPALITDDFKILPLLPHIESSSLLTECNLPTFPSFLSGVNLTPRENIVTEKFIHTEESGFRSFIPPTINIPEGDGEHDYISIGTSPGSDEDALAEKARQFANDVFAEQHNPQEMNVDQVISQEKNPPFQEDTVNPVTSVVDNPSNNMENLNISTEDYVSTPIQEVQMNLHESSNVNSSAINQELLEENKTLKAQLEAHRIFCLRPDQPSISSPLQTSSMNALDFMFVAARLGLLVPDAFEDPLIKILAGNRIEELKTLLQNAIKP